MALNATTGETATDQFALTGFISSITDFVTQTATEVSNGLRDLATSQGEIEDAFSTVGTLSAAQQQQALYDQQQRNLAAQKQSALSTSSETPNNIAAMLVIGFGLYMVFYGAKS